MPARTCPRSPARNRDLLSRQARWSPPWTAAAPVWAVSGSEMAPFGETEYGPRLIRWLIIRRSAWDPRDARVLAAELVPCEAVGGMARVYAHLLHCTRLARGTLAAITRQAWCRYPGGRSRLAGWFAHCRETAMLVAEKLGRFVLPVNEFVADVSRHEPGGAPSPLVFQFRAGADFGRWRAV